MDLNNTVFYNQTEFYEILAIYKKPFLIKIKHYSRLKRMITATIRPLFIMNSEVILSIIIVNYNGIRFIKNCIDSINTFVNVSHEIILVDNASNDGSQEYIRANFPTIKFIENKINTGFTGGNNIGGKEAKGKYLLLLNNDTELCTPVLPLLRQFSTDPQLGVVGCKMRYANEKLQYSFGYEHVPSRIILSWLGLKKIKFLPRYFKKEETDAQKYKTEQTDIDYVSGAFLVTTKKLWDQLEGLDENFFMYIEDVDFCKRAKNMGYRIKYFPDMKIIHFEGGGKEWIGYTALNYTIDSYLLYTKKFHGIFNVYVVKICLALVFMIRSLAFMVKALIHRAALYKDQSEAYFKIGLRLVLKK
jgi:N-acetylglucosaminyl-diphospho-decaprenol L-rhamnosyltransferase